MVTNIKSETATKFSPDLNSKNSTKENWKSIIRASQTYLGIKVCLPQHSLLKLLMLYLQLIFFFLLHFLHIITVQSELIHTNTFCLLPRRCSVAYRDCSVSLSVYVTHVTQSPLCLLQEYVCSFTLTVLQQTSPLTLGCTFKSAFLIYILALKQGPAAMGCCEFFDCSSADLYRVVPVPAVSWMQSINTGRIPQEKSNREFRYGKEQPLRGSSYSPLAH